MKIGYRRQPVVLCAILAVTITGFLYFSGPSIRAAEGGAPADPALKTKATAGVIASVCDAQKVKAANPEAEIPPEFNKPYPSLEACLAYEKASDPNSPGPLQPIAFSHKHHAGTYQIACLYCHTGTDRSRAAGVPSVELCMGCHKNFAKEFDEFEGIRVLKQKWKKKEPIVWVQIHHTAEFVKFRHNRHVAASAKLTCQRCHGPVKELDKLYKVPDPAFGRMPAKKLQMGWCISCHRTKGASQDCATCHY